MSTYNNQLLTFDRKTGGVLIKAKLIRETMTLDKFNNFYQESLKKIQAFGFEIDVKSSDTEKNNIPVSQFTVKLTPKQSKGKLIAKCYNDALLHCVAIGITSLPARENMYRTIASSLQKQEQREQEVENLMGDFEMIEKPKQNEKTTTRVFLHKDTQKLKVHKEFPYLVAKRQVESSAPEVEGFKRTIRGKGKSYDVKYKPMNKLGIKSSAAALINTLSKKGLLPQEKCSSLAGGYLRALPNQCEERDKLNELVTQNVPK